MKGLQTCKAFQASNFTFRGNCIESKNIPDDRVLIRNERPEDYQCVEALTRSAFYNLYIPGCVEHYLVHIMRQHRDFVPELDFVLERDGQVIGNIMYTKARLVDEAGTEKEILTFGPVMQIEEQDAQRFDEGLEPMEKKYQTSQEEFYIHSHAVLQ